MIYLNTDSREIELSNAYRGQRRVNDFKVFLKRRFRNCKVYEIPT